MEENRLNGDNDNDGFIWKMIMVFVYCYVIVAVIIAFNLTNSFITEHGWLAWGAGGFIYCSLKALLWIFWIWF